MTTRDLIRQSVDASGLNARELSDATGGNVSLQTIWRYIEGKGDITTEKLDHLMRVLGLEWPKAKKRK